MIHIHLRFYAELNDFLPLEKRSINFDYAIAEKASIKDVIESLNVPHTEVELLLVNGKSVNFDYQVQDNDHISVYPVFESLDVSDLIHLRPHPLRNPRFILDVHLGKLTKYMRLLGFDAVYNNSFSDKEIVLLNQKETRIILSRDVGLFKNKSITHGYWIREIDPEKQISEVLNRFDLYKKCKPFIRCIECNGLLKPVNKKDISSFLPPLTKKHYENFMQCASCNKIYWAGTHYHKLNQWIKKTLQKGG